MTLRDSISDKHIKAEKHCFINLLLDKKITEEVYADFLFQQYQCYSALEKKAKEYGLLDGIEDIARTQKIFDDFIEFGLSGSHFKSTQNYITHIDTLSKEQVLAHLYVRHFGDMYGGQMIKRLIPGKGSMYEFENRPELIAKVREMLTDDLADEANVCFDFVLELFDELAIEHNLH